MLYYIWNLYIIQKILFSHNSKNIIESKKNYELIHHVECEHHVELLNWIGYPNLKNKKRSKFHNKFIGTIYIGIVQYVQEWDSICEGKK